MTARTLRRMLLLGLALLGGVALLPRPTPPLVRGRLWVRFAITVVTPDAPTDPWRVHLLLEHTY